MTALATVAIAVFSVTEIGPQGSHAFSTDLSTTTRAKFYYLQQSEINGNNIGAVSSHRSSLSTLFAKVRRSGGGGGASKKSLNRKKKAQSNSRKGALLKSNKSQNSKKENTSPGLTSNSSPPPSAPSSPSGQRAPPWQVLSQKDAKKNIQREKKRREAIQEGRISPSVTSAQLFQEYGDDIDHDDDDFDAPMKVSSSFLNPADKALLGWKRFNPSTVSMRYVASVLDRQKLPRLGVPEVAFLGRSNVGKSSLLNRLSSYSKKEAGVKDEARVGKTPGATASVNLFAFYDKKEKPMMGFVDLPGFGYAKLSKGVKESVQEAAERYLDKRKELVLGILLVDIRRVPSDDDRAVLAALFDQGLPIVVIATKVDKVNKNDLEGQLGQIREGLGLPDGQPFTVSSVTGEGTKALWNLILEASEDRVEEFQLELERGGTLDSVNDEQTKEEEEDDENLVYSQGYDWIQDGDVLFEGSDVDYYEVEDDGFLDYEYDPIDDAPVAREESLKELKERAKKLEEENRV